MTEAEGEKLAGIDVKAQVNVIEKVQVNDTPLTVTDKSVNIEIPVLDIRAKKENNTTESMLNNDKIAIFDPIAFDGDVKNLKQTDTVLVFNCGSASILIENENMT